MAVDFDERPGWHADALCNTGDATLVDVFFGHHSHARSAADFDGERAKQICHLCPVQPVCLTTALDLPENPHGVWGATTRAERTRLRQQRHQHPWGHNPKARPIDHGTAAGYTAHVRRGDDPCPPCLHAHASQVNESKRRRREHTA